MSGSGDIISFDLRRGKGEPIDLAAMLPLSRLHPLDHSGGRDILDDMTIPREVPDLVQPMCISVERFRTLETLDIATQDIRIATTLHAASTHSQRRISIIPPLYIPYGSIDVRRNQKYIISQKYADLFTRTLPYGLMVRRTMKTTGHIIRKNKRPIAYAIGAFFLCSIPLLFFVKTSVERGYGELMALTHATGGITPRDHVLAARGHFERAQVVFAPFSWIPVDKIQVASIALRGGLALSRGLDTITRTLPTETEALIGMPKSHEITPTYRGTAEDIFPLAALGVENPTNWLKDHINELQIAENYFAEAGEIYSSISHSSSFSDMFQSVGGVLKSSAKTIAWYRDNQDNVLSLLGDDDPKRYIIFNQNRDEIRANGGFPGTVITLTLYKGNILDLRKDDVYYYDWNLYPYKELPPPGIALLTDSYGLRDVNYYPDFRTTLEKANSFIERSGDSTLTSGIAIHQGIVEDILERIGPVNVPGVRTPFTHENFSALMSTLVETQYGRETHAKDILFDFMDALIHKIHEQKLYMTLIDVLIDSWNRGDILLASRDHATDEFLAKYRKPLPWECNETSSPTCSQNWIYPVFTSVGGNKTDRYIDRTYRSTVTKILGCKYENLITLTNTHTWNNDMSKTIQGYLDDIGIQSIEDRAKYMFIQGNSKNTSFVRIYTPLSSELSLTGSDIKTEVNEHAVVFSFTLETPPGASASKTIRYTTNIPNCQSYTGDVDWFIQPGLRKVDIK